MYVFYRLKCTLFTYRGIWNYISNQTNHPAMLFSSLFSQRLEELTAVRILNFVRAIRITSSITVPWDVLPESSLAGELIILTCICSLLARLGTGACGWAGETAGWTPLDDVDLDSTVDVCWESSNCFCWATDDAEGACNCCCICWHCHMQHNIKKNIRQSGANY